MNASHLLLRFSARIGIASFLLTGVLAIAAPTTNKSGPAPAKPAAAPQAEPEIPQSVFTLPADLKEGRDPFFPNSPLRGISTPVLKPSTNINQKVELVLNGISPSSEKPLAMINGKTFAKGEEQDVPLGSSRRIRVLLVEIKMDSVIVEVNGVRQQLRLKAGLN
jgi:hypothetical protein